MPRPPRTTDDAERRARETITSTTDIEQLRICQAVLLPLQGLTLEQTALILGRDKFWVARVRNRFIRGEPAPAAHGGRRNAHFNDQQESRFLKGAFLEYWRRTRLDRTDPESESTLREVIRESLERATRRSVSDSTITDLLNRETRRYLPHLKWSDHRYIETVLQFIAVIDRDIEYWKRRSPSQSA